MVLFFVLLSKFVVWLIAVFVRIDKLYGIIALFEISEGNEGDFWVFFYQQQRTDKSIPRDEIMLLGTLGKNLYLQPKIAKKHFKVGGK